LDYHVGSDFSNFTFDRENHEMKIKATLKE